jgi:hypothetical protein
MQSSKSFLRIGLTVGWLVALGAAGCGDSGSIGPVAPTDGSGDTGGGGGDGGGGPEAPRPSPSSSAGAAGVTSPTPGSEDQTDVAGLEPSSDTSTGAAGTSPSDDVSGAAACTPGACAAIDVNADGATEPACCTMAGGCGGLLAFMGMSFCAPANVGAAVAPEPIVTDARCLAQTFPNPADGGTLTLPGCCDASGVCGVSTASVTASDAGVGIPAACLTPTDLAGFGGLGDAGAPVSCR